MKKLPTTVSVLTMVVILMCTAYSQAVAAPIVTIELLNPPPDGLLPLDVGESYTFNIQIDSTEPFILALAMTNAYYPGRGVFWHGSDRETHATSATLHLTIKGKKPTAELAEVHDWPEPGDDWPEGVAPVTIAAGVRFKGGQVHAEQFAFAVEVPRPSTH